MIYLKSLLAGLAALIILATLLIGGAFFLAPLVIERLAPGVGGVGSYVLSTPYVSIWTVIGGAVGIFAVVSYWAFRRASRDPGPKS
jgi:membrane protein implicated in regulation of membrane protease activity